MHENESIRGALTTALYGIYLYIVGLNYQSFLILIVLMALDTLIAILFASLQGKFITKKMKKGLATKMALLLLLMALTLLQITLADYGISAPFSNMVAGLLSVMEMMSILETFAENEVILPKKITKWFATVGKNIVDGEESDE